ASASAMVPWSAASGAVLACAMLACAVAPCVASRRPTARATASSSSTTSGGSAAPEASWYPPSTPGCAVTGLAEPGEPVHVPAERARGDAEPLGEFRARPEPVILQQGEQAERAGACVRHGSDSASHCGQKLTLMAPSMGFVRQSSPIDPGNARKAEAHDLR